MNQLTVVSGSQAGLPTIIGATPARFPIGGKIRAGIKALTQAAARHPEALLIYEAGVKAGKAFEEIETEITRAAPDLKYPLVPKNVPYFTVRRADFAMPEVADLILEKFGEDRGDGVTRLYHFPVVFPADAWQAIMPHALMCYGASQLKYWSEYSPNGRERHCMTFDQVPVDSNGKRAIRIFGGRKHVTRTENNGRCDPEMCPEYQSKQCNLTGRFIFLIPGVPSINAIELATNSFYSMNAARQTLETVGFLRGGRIGGFLDGNTSFWLTKRQHEVSMIGEDGQPRRVAQWLIELEAPVDLTRLLRIEGDETRLIEGERAAAVLNGATPALDDPAIHADAAGPTASAATEAIGHEDEATSPAPTNPPAELSPAKATPAAAPPTTDALGQLFDLLSALQIPREKFERYAKKKYGAGWNRNPNGIRRVLSAVEAFKSNRGGLLAAVEVELGAVA
jgi:Recombination directionality factor-like